MQSKLSTRTVRNPLIPIDKFNTQYLLKKSRRLPTFIAGTLMRMRQPTLIWLYLCRVLLFAHRNLLVFRELKVCKTF